MQFIIQIIGTGASLMLAFLLLTNYGNKNSFGNKWLSFHVMGIFTLFMDDIFSHENIYFSYPHTYGLVPIAALILIPSLYFATIFYTQPNYQYKKTDIFHFSPLLLYCILNITFYFSSTEDKLIAYKQDSFGSESLDSLLMITFFMQAFIYGFIMIQIWSKHKKITSIYSANDSEIQLNWLRDFIRIVISLIIFWLIETILQIGIVTLLFNLLVLVGLFLLAYFSLKQRSIFPSSIRERKEILSLIQQKKKEVSRISKKAPILKDEELTSLVEKLDTCMKNDKPYLEEDINIARLADYVETSSYKLSYLLNQYYKKNFSTFINDFRIQEAIRLLSDPEMTHLNIMQIGYASGFGSKTVFNTTFKRLTNTTPTKYRKLI